MQIISSIPGEKKEKKKRSKPPLLYLHGSFHAAWCWTEHFFPYFVNKGYPCVALSWRGTGGTYAGDGVRKVKILEHVSDLADVLDYVLPEIVGGTSPIVKPVVVSHSFGGLAIMKLLETQPERTKDLSGIVAMCSVPPSGNGKMTMRFLRRSLADSWTITRGLAMKKCITNPELCRELFFGGKDDEGGGSGGVSDDDIARYQRYFARDTEATIDLFDLAKALPSMRADDGGRAPFVNDDSFPPALVIGATDDFIVDKEGVEETARYFGLDEPVYVDSPHG